MKKIQSIGKEDQEEATMSVNAAPYIMPLGSLRRSKAYTGFGQEIVDLWASPDKKKKKKKKQEYIELSKLFYGS